MKIRQIVEKHLHDNIVTLYDMGIIQKKGTKSMRKIWGKENGGNFGLGRKNLGSDTDTET